MGGNPGGWVADRLGVGGTAKDILKDPIRAQYGLITGGLSEVGAGIDNKMFNDPRNKAEDAGAKAAVQAEKMIQQEQDRQTTMDANRQRDLQRARMRSMGANRGGRSSTILTGPLGTVGGTSGGRKTLLGM
jgi:hypothetical protein